MEVVAYFENNSKKHIIALSENNMLQYFVKDNSGIKKELSKSENEMFKKVLDSIKISKETSIDLGIKHWRNKLFRLFYDKQACLYYTDNDNSEIMSYLNFKYNNTPDIYCEDYMKYNETNETNENNETITGKNKFFKVPIRIGEKIIFLFLVATISLSSLSACNSLAKNSDENMVAISEMSKDELKESNETLQTETKISNNKENALVSIDSNQEIQQYDYLELEKAIDSNENLTNEEKDFIKKMRFVFDENHQFMDIEMVKERLATIKINYQEDKATNVNVEGTYNSSKNIITMYRATSFNDCNINVFIHEFLHSLQKLSSSFLIELSDEFFSREIIRKLYDEGYIQKERLISGNPLGEPIFGKGYDDYMAIYYTLAEIIDRDSLRKYQFDCDVNTLVHALAYCKDDNRLDAKEAYNFVANINNARSFDEKTHMYIPTNDSYETRKNAYNSLNYYYNIKKGHNIDEDLDVSIYYLHQASSGGIITDKFTPYSYDCIEDVIGSILLKHSEEIYENSMFGAYRIVTAKTYLSDDHPDTFITFNSPAITTVELDDSINKEFRDAYQQYKETEEEIGQEEIGHD